MTKGVTCIFQEYHNTKLLALASIQNKKLLEDKVDKYHHGLKYRTPSHRKRLFFSVRKAYIATLI